jgi:tryptophanyl-tRNA synthetase
MGLDGRKMSKSYGNIIPIFAPEKELRKLVMRIVTNSQGVEEPKDPETCTIFSIYRNFASPEQVEALRQRYLAGGMGWGQAKQELFEVMNAALTPLRERYTELMANPRGIIEILEEGSARARQLAAEKIRMLRDVIGMD